MLAELSRREKEAGIKPDPDIDVFMKVREEAITFVKLIFRRGETPCTPYLE
jgi:hypothetical protein